MLNILIYILICNLIQASIFNKPKVEPLPVVIWHGMGDTCCDPQTIGRVKAWIQDHNPSTFVYSIQIGKDSNTDRWASFFGNVNEQVKEVCQQLKNIKELVKGFHAIGFSQGGLFLRAYIERCNSPPIKNLVTMGSPHAGISNPPGCDSTPDSWGCNAMRSAIRSGAYSRFIRSRVVQAQYIRDPKKINDYLNYNIFLPDINNEKKTKNQTYARNLASLQTFVMIRFSEDHTLDPKDSSWFSSIEEGTEKTVPLRDQDIYKEDWIGLKQLDVQGRLQFLSCPTEHMQFKKEYFISSVLPYLVPLKQKEQKQSSSRQVFFQLKAKTSDN